MSATEAIDALATLDVLCDVLCEHARHAAEAADERLAGGDRVKAATRLVEASELYRLAAHALDRNVSPVSG